MTSAYIARRVKTLSKAWFFKWKNVNLSSTRLDFANQTKKLMSILKICKFSFLSLNRHLILGKRMVKLSKRRKRLLVIRHYLLDKKFLSNTWHSAECYLIQPRASLAFSKLIRYSIITTTSWTEWSVPPDSVNKVKKICWWNRKCTFRKRERRFIDRFTICLCWLVSLVAW